MQISAVLAFCVSAVLSYLLGCVNGAILSSHLFFHDDVRKHGSGNRQVFRPNLRGNLFCTTNLFIHELISPVQATL